MLNGPRTRWACVQIADIQVVETDGGWVPQT